MLMCQCNFWGYYNQGEKCSEDVAENRLCGCPVLRIESCSRPPNYPFQLYLTLLCTIFVYFQTEEFVTFIEKFSAAPQSTNDTELHFPPLKTNTTNHRQNTRIYGLHLETTIRAYGLLKAEEVCCI